MLSEKDGSDIFTSVIAYYRGTYSFGLFLLSVIIHKIYFNLCSPRLYKECHLINSIIKTTNEIIP